MGPKLYLVILWTFVLANGVNARDYKRTGPPSRPSCVNFTPFVYAGCFEDDSGPRTLLYRSDLDFKTVTVEKCVAFCKGNDYRYAGLEYYGECWCGATVSGAQIEESQCSFPCNGNQTELCGGNKALSIYQDPTFLSVDSTSISDYKPMGCYSEGPNGRTLAWRQTDVSNTNLTIHVCLHACKAGAYPFGGVEFGQECYCGVVLGNGTVPLDSTKCNMQCTGNYSQYCGGRSTLNLYVAEDLESMEPCVRDGHGSTPSSSTSLIITTLKSASLTVSLTHISSSVSSQLTSSKIFSSSITTSVPNIIVSSTSSPSGLSARPTTSQNSTSIVSSLISTSSHLSTFDTSPSLATATSEPPSLSKSVSSSTSNQSLAPEPSNLTTVSTKTPSIPISTSIITSTSFSGSSSSLLGLPSSMSTTTPSSDTNRASSATSLSVLPSSNLSTFSSASPCSIADPNSSVTKSQTPSYSPYVDHGTPSLSITIQVPPSFTRDPATSATSWDDSEPSQSGVTVRPTISSSKLSTQTSSLPTTSIASSSDLANVSSSFATTSGAPLPTTLPSSKPSSPTSYTSSTNNLSSNILPTPAATSVELKCTSTITVYPSPTCEYKLGKWCASFLPQFSDYISCWKSFAACITQLSSCFKNAGDPSNTQCDKFDGYCSGLNSYCDKKCPGPNCSLPAFRGSIPRGEDQSESSFLTSIYPCQAASISPLFPGTAETPPGPSETFSPPYPSSVPPYTNICTQPNKPPKGYDSDSPVGNVKLPLLACNNERSGFDAGRPFKLYLFRNKSNCPSYQRSGDYGPSQGCRDACTEQYNNCINSYAESCRDSKKSKAKRGGRDNYSIASKKCKDQRDDCYLVNNFVNGEKICKNFSPGPY